MAPRLTWSTGGLGKVLVWVLGFGSITLVTGSSFAPWPGCATAAENAAAFLHGEFGRFRPSSSAPFAPCRSSSTTTPPAPPPAAVAKSRTDVMMGQSEGTRAGWDGVSRRGKARNDHAGACHAVSVLLHDEPMFFGGRQPFTSHAARWFIKRCILSRAKASAALRVEVEARSNRDAVNGRWESVSVEFQKMVFDDIQVTGGARFELLGVDLLTLGLLPGPCRRLRRLRRPCEVAGTSQLTDADVAYSPAIRRLAQRVVNHALRPRARKIKGGGGGEDYDREGVAPASDSLSRQQQVVEAAGGGDAAASLGAEGGGGRRQHQHQQQQQQQGDLEPRVDVLGVRVHGSKLSIEGEMSNGGPFLRVPFRYDFSLSASRDGHILHFKGSNVYWGTPGGQVPLPMLPLQSFNIDLGDRARLDQLKISGGVISVGGRFILTNTPGFTVANTGLKRGNINFDLAESLSRLVSNVLRLRRE